MDRIDNVDLREALHDIAKNNTVFHLEGDLGYSFGFMERAARMDDPAEKRILWVSYPSGVDCYSERQAFQKDTRDYNGIQFHGKDMRRDRKLAYAVEVTGLEDGKLTGNLFQIDLGRYADTVRQSALASQTKRLYLQNGEQITMPKAEYDDRYPLDLPKWSYDRNEPDDPAALQGLMDKARAEREAACTPSDLWLHTSNLYDDRRAFYTGQLLGDLSKLEEPNDPGRQTFSVGLSYYIAYSYDAEQLSKLLDALPFDNAMFAVQKGKPRDMRLVVPREEVMRHRQAGVEKPSTIAELQGQEISVQDLASILEREIYSSPGKEKPSVLARLQEGKKAAVQGEESAKTSPKRHSEREV